MPPYTKYHVWVMYCTLIVIYLYSPNVCVEEVKMYNWVTRGDFVLAYLATDGGVLGGHFWWSRGFEVLGGLEIRIGAGRCEKDADERRKGKKVYSNATVA